MRLAVVLSNALEGPKKEGKQRKTRTQWRDGQKGGTVGNKGTLDRPPPS